MVANLRISVYHDSMNATTPYTPVFVFGGIWGQRQGYTHLGTKKTGKLLNGGKRVVGSNLFNNFCIGNGDYVIN